MSVILSTFPLSGREQESVGCAGAEGLRAFSELNYAHEPPFFFFSLNAPVRSVTVSNLRFSPAHVSYPTCPFCPSINPARITLE